MKRLTSLFHPVTVKRQRRLLVRTFTERRSWFSTNKFLSRKAAFDALKLPSNSSDNEIKKTYFELAKKWHPDVQIGKSEREKEVAKIQFDKIKTAFEYLQTHTAEVEAEEKRYAQAQARAQNPYTVPNKTGGGMNRHFGKAPPTDRGGDRATYDYTAENYKAGTGLPPENKPHWSFMYDGWGRMIFAVGVACLLWLGLQKERARTRYMKRTYQGKGDNQYIESKETIPQPMENMYVSDTPPPELEAISRETGVQPIRTGRGWDWTPVAHARKQKQKEYDAKESQRRIQEHQLKLKKKRQLIKKIKKLDEKNKVLKDEIASLKAQISETKNGK